MPTKLRLAVYKFASCDGCQLQLLDAQGKLLEIARRIDIDHFLEARSQVRRPLAWPRPPHERVAIRVTRYAPAHHWLDPDNLTGGLKPVLDGLKAHALIANDTAKDITLETHQDVSATNLARWTEIRLSLDPPTLREVHA